MQMFAFGVDSIPVGKVFPASRHAADLRAGAVEQDDQGVVPEHLRNRGLLVFEVVLVGMFDLAVAFLEFDEDQGQTVEEADQVGTLLVDAAR